MFTRLHTHRTIFAALTTRLDVPVTLLGRRRLKLISIPFTPARSPIMFKRMLATITASTATVACALAVLGAGAGTAMAPEAGRLNSNSPLAASTNAWAYGTYIDSGTPTYGFYTSNAWKTGYYYANYAGYPCSRYAQPAGTKLGGYIMVSGGWSRCSEY